MADQEQPQSRVSHVLDDPSAQAVARVYAIAFLDAAAAGNVDEAMEEFHSFINDVLVANPKFEYLLLSGMLNRNERLAIVNRVLATHGSDLFTNFVRILAKHERLDLLPLIARESQLLHEDRCGQKRVSVTSAVQLSDDAIKSISERLNAAFSFEPIIETKTDASLLGGLVIRVENTVYDGSLRVRMKQLRTRLRERSLNEIQSGRDRFSHPEGD